MVKAPDLQAEAEKIARSVTIYRDTYGVPHVYGAHRRERRLRPHVRAGRRQLLQIEEDYIHALGRASEVYGEKRLLGDLARRAFEVTKLSMAEYRRASPGTRQLCDAFAAGLNYFLARSPQVKPRLLAHFEPWHIFAMNRGVSGGTFSSLGLKLEEPRAAAPEQGRAAARADLRLEDVRATDVAGTRVAGRVEHGPSAPPRARVGTRDAVHQPARRLLRGRPALRGAPAQ